MAPRIMTLLMAAVLVSMLPQSGWAAPHPEVAVLGNTHLITGGNCQLWPRSARVDMQYNPQTNVVQCPDLEQLTGGLRGPFAVEIHLRHIPLSEPATPSEDCQLAYGRVEAGSCWYKSATGQSCTAACQEFNLLYDAATATYAGSPRNGGTQRGCRDVAAMFDPPISRVIPGENRGALGRLGCSGHSESTWWLIGERTTAGASNQQLYRYCACHPPASTSCLRAGGHPYAGVCFYKGAAAASCDATCASVSRSYDPYTADLVGPRAEGGTPAACLEVASAYGASRVIQVVGFDIAGCTGAPGLNSVAFYSATGDFDAGDSSPDVQRYCACQEEAD